MNRMAVVGPHLTNKNHFFHGDSCLEWIFNEFCGIARCMHCIPSWNHQTPFYKKCNIIPGKRRSFTNKKNHSLERGILSIGTGTIFLEIANYSRNGLNASMYNPLQ